MLVKGVPAVPTASGIPSCPAAATMKAVIAVVVALCSSAAVAAYANNWRATKAAVSPASDSVISPLPATRTAHDSIVAPPFDYGVPSLAAISPDGAMNSNCTNLNIEALTGITRDVIHVCQRARASGSATLHATIAAAMPAASAYSHSAERSYASGNIEGIPAGFHPFHIPGRGAARSKEATRPAH